MESTEDKAEEERTEPRTYTVDESAEILRISRSAAFRAVQRGELPAIRVGRNLRVPAWRLRELLGEVER